MTTLAPPNLRNAPTQARSRERLRRVLDAAETVLATEGAQAVTTTRIAEVAGVPVGSVYRFFPDKDAIVDAVAVGYWQQFEELVADLAGEDEREPLADPVSAVLETLAAGFRSEPGFRALWYGGLRTERVRDVTRATRAGFNRSLERVLAVHWPGASADLRATAARMLVLVGDGLLREAFRLRPEGDEQLLAETKRVVDAYLRARLGERQR